jgi:hypothetical protein
MRFWTNSLDIQPLHALNVVLDYIGYLMTDFLNLYTVMLLLTDPSAPDLIQLYFDVMHTYMTRYTNDGFGGVASAAFSLDSSLVAI